MGADEVRVFIDLKLVALGLEMRFNGLLNESFVREVIPSGIYSRHPYFSFSSFNGAEADRAGFWTGRADGYVLGFISALPVFLVSVF